MPALTLKKLPVNPDKPSFFMVRFNPGFGRISQRKRKDKILW
jgi:hypothetical protein